MASVAILLLVAGLTAWSVFYIFRCLQLRFHRHRLATKHGCRPCPAYAQKDPVFGIDTYIETIQGYRAYHFLDLLTRRHQQYGRTFSFSVFGSKTISTCDPDVLKCTLSSHFKDFSNGDLRARSVAPLLGRGIVAADGDEWHHQRALIRPSFARAQTTDLDIFERHATHLINAIERKGFNVDMQELVQQMVLDANTEYLFGDSIGLLDECASESALLLNQALDYALEGIIVRLQLGKLMPFYRDAKFWDSCKTVQAFANRYVAQALELTKLDSKSRGALDEQAILPGRYILLNEMARDTRDPALLRDEIVTIIMAARDTTSATISFALYLLARRPDIWVKLRADVEEHYISPMTFEALEQMKYLKWVVAETLRLFPPIANNGRMAVRDTIFPVGGGPTGKAPLLVTKGTTVFFSTYVMQRRTDLWGPDAETFRPERWSPDSENKGRHGWEYLPFLGGPRICPGQKFALTQTSHALARLAHAFEKIDNMDPNEWREQWTLSVAPKDGVKVKMVPAVK